MKDYDGYLSAAKRHATAMLCRVIQKTADVEELGQAIDDLNKAWDELTSCLIHQRAEYVDLITELVAKLAEERRK